MKIKQLIVLLAFIAFWFEGNTLYWTDGQQVIQDQNYPYYLKFQLNKKMPPDVDMSDITQISVGKKVVRIWTEDRFYNLFYSDDVEGHDWYVKGPYGPDGKL